MKPEIEQKIIKQLSLKKNVLFCHHNNEVMCNECAKNIRGNVSCLTGNVSCLTGNVSGIRGNVSGITGDVSGITGDVSGIRGDVSDIKEILEKYAKKSIKMDTL